MELPAKGEGKSASSRYRELAVSRDVFLERGRECAALTIPSLLPPAGHTPGAKMLVPWQSVGALGVNTLANKLLLSLLPPDMPFFRLKPEGRAERELREASEDTRGPIEQALLEIEVAAQNEVDTNHIRVTLFEALKHLIVTGNGLLYWPAGEALRFYRLDQYVILRDPAGALLELVIEEGLSYATLPDNVRQLLSPNERERYERSPRDIIKVYTWLRRLPRRYTIHQELENGARVPGSEGFYPLNRLPWLPLRMVRIQGESYGRSYVEEYLGDLRSLEGLRRAIVEASAAASKVVFLVRPNGTTRPRVIAQAENLSVLVGNKEDVSVLQLDKFADLQIAFRAKEEITRALESAFLMASAVQRHAERVTAEEIRRLAADLDQVLGGIYSLLTQELLLPLAKIILARLAAKGVAPDLTGKASPAVVAGVAAIGRGNDYANLMGFLRDLGPLTAQVLPMLNMKELLRRLMGARSIPTSGLLLRDDELMQAQGAAQANDLLREAAPEVVRALATHAADIPVS